MQSTLRRSFVTPTGAESREVFSQADALAAFDRHQFQIAFQPILGANDHIVVGCEALLRWHHPTLGEQSAARFVPLLERSELILTIGDWVLENAARRIVTWDARGLPQLRLGVNVAPLQIQTPDFPQRVLRILENVGLPASRLALEISQEALTARPEATRRQIERLAALGVEVHLDDYRLGPALIEDLKTTALRGIKVDGRVLAAFSEPGSKLRSPMAAMIAFARQRGMRTVAKSVQSDEEVVSIFELELDEVQGHLLCPVVSIEAFEQYLSSHAKI